jgi:hypothetical protein
MGTIQLLRSTRESKASQVTMRKLRRDNHFLPECYQRGFADDSGKVWVKQAGESEPRHRKVENVGKRRNFYVREVRGVEDDKIEQFFGKDVEDGFARVSQRITTESHKIELSGAECGFLARFIAAQAVRTVAHQRCIEELAGGPVNRSTYLNVMLRQILQIMKAWDDGVPKFQFLTTLPLVTHHFITGDSPVLVFNPKPSAISTPVVEATPTITMLPELLENPQTEFLITLSPYMAVSVGRLGPTAPLVQLTPLDPVVVLKIDQHIRDQSRLFTLARDRESL